MLKTFKCISLGAFLVQAHALEIRIDYTYDTNNFFNTQEKRDAMEAVADFYGNMIQDNLLRIDQSEFSASWTASFFHPSTGALQTIPGLVVPEDVIIVYVGGRGLGGSTAGVAGPGGFTSASGGQLWFDRVLGRGQPGAESLTPSENTDYAPWGGSISFDNSSRTWNFSQTGNQPGTEFMKIALHEMGHVLGIGTADTWDNQLSGGTFTGPAVINSFGSAPGADGGHFQGSLNSELFGSFGVTHGSSRPVLMLPGSIDTGTNFDVATDLDLAALVDIGWEIRPKTELRSTALSPSAASFNWNSVSFRTYQVQRSVNLSSFASGGSLQGNGNGLVQAWSDPAPPADRAFYRLRVDEVNFPAPSIEISMDSGDAAQLESISKAPKLVEGCDYECCNSDRP